MTERAAGEGVRLVRQRVGLQLPTRRPRRTAATDGKREARYGAGTSACRASSSSSSSREMLLIRRFEEKVEERFRAGELAGFLHACIGQEAVAVGVCRALDDGDVIGSTHRAHGHVLANGTPPNEVMAELYGKVEGCSHGYGGSMHLYDVAPRQHGRERRRRRRPAGGRRRRAGVPDAPRAARCASPSSATGRRTSAPSTSR